MAKRASLLALLSVVAAPLLASAAVAAFDKVGHQLVCQCGCNQILLECNHVGCPVSPVMIRELQGQIASGLSSTGVFNWFVSKYGAIVLAAPIRGGFDVVAWITPFVVLALGTLGVVWLVKFWHHRGSHLQPAFAESSPEGPASDQLRARIRQEIDDD